MKSFIQKFAFLKILAILIAIKCSAQFGSGLVWTGAVSDNWNNALNWSPAQVPDLTSTVFLMDSVLPHQPKLSGDVAIRNFLMLNGKLDLQGYTLFCDSLCGLAGDTITAGKITASYISEFRNTRVYGRLTLEHTEFNYANQPGGLYLPWSGGNKIYGDSLLVKWNGKGTLLMQNIFADSIYGVLKISSGQLSTEEYGIHKIGIGNAGAFISGDLVLNNPGRAEIQIGNSKTGTGRVNLQKNIVGLNTNKLYPFALGGNHFSIEKTDLYGGSGSLILSGRGLTIDSSNIYGNFQFETDTVIAYTYLRNSRFFGTLNITLRRLDTIKNCLFYGISNFTVASSMQLNPPFIQTGNNKFYNTTNYNFSFITPGTSNAQMRLAYYAADTVYGNLTINTTGPIDLNMFTSGHSYVENNLQINGDNQDNKSVRINNANNANASVNINGNLGFQSMLFNSPLYGFTLNRVNVNGSFTSPQPGQLKKTAFIARNSIFNGGVEFLADSAFDCFITDCKFLGSLNKFTGGNIEVSNSVFNTSSTGNTILEISKPLAETNYGAALRSKGNNYKGNLTIKNYSLLNNGGAGAVTYLSYQGVQDTVINQLQLDFNGYSELVDYAIPTLVGGNLIINNNILPFSSFGTKTFAFFGSGNHSYNSSGIEPIFSTISIDKEGSLTLLKPLTVQTMLNLTKGIIISSATAPVKLIQSYIGGSIASYVNGPFVKKGFDGLQEFVFPIGSNGLYAPVTAVHNNIYSYPDSLTAQYFNKNATIDGYNIAQKDAGLHHLDYNEYWKVDRTGPGTSSFKIKLWWSKNRTGDISLLNDLRVAHWDGAIWKDAGNAATAGNTNDGSIISSNSFTSLSPFTLASSTIQNTFNNAVLPVTLISFKGYKNNSQTNLQWATSYEYNAAIYEIERGDDGIKFSKIATKAAMNSSTGATYSFSDNHPLYGINYYRLRMVDIDGRFTYSKIIRIDFSENVGISIYPNPAKDEMFIRSAVSIQQVQLTDIKGRLIKQFAPSLNNRYSVRDILPGVYFVRIISDKETETQKILIER